MGATANWGLATFINELRFSSEEHCLMPTLLHTKRNNPFFVL